MDTIFVGGASFTLRMLISVVRDCHSDWNVSDQVYKFIFTTHDTGVVMEVLDYRAYKSGTPSRGEWEEFDEQVPESGLTLDTHNMISGFVKLPEDLEPVLLQLMRMLDFIWILLPGRVYTSVASLEGKILAGHWYDWPKYDEIDP